MISRRLVPAAIGVVALVGCSARAASPRSRRNPSSSRLVASSPPPTVAVPSPSVVTTSPAPVSSTAPSAPAADRHRRRLVRRRGKPDRIGGRAEPSASSERAPSSPSRVGPHRRRLGASIGTLRISGDRARIDAGRSMPSSCRAMTARSVPRGDRQRRPERRSVHDPGGRCDLGRHGPRAGQHRERHGRHRHPDRRGPRQPDRMSGPPSHLSQQAAAPLAGRRPAGAADSRTHRSTAPRSGRSRGRRAHRRPPRPTGTRARRPHPTSGR